MCALGVWAYYDCLAFQFHPYLPPAWPAGGGGAAAAAQVCPSPAYLPSGFTCLPALELKDAVALRRLRFFLPVGAGLGRGAFPERLLPGGSQIAASERDLRPGAARASSDRYSAFPSLVCFPGISPGKVWAGLPRGDRRGSFQSWVGKKKNHSSLLSMAYGPAPAACQARQRASEILQWLWLTCLTSLCGCLAEGRCQLQQFRKAPSFARS